MALRSPLTIQPYDYIGDTTGRPLNYGKIYIGEAGLDPEFYPIPVYLDAEMTKPVDQPIMANDGYAGFAGDFTELYASNEIYSVKILDKQGRKVLYKSDMTRNNLMSDALAELSQAVDETMSIARESLDTLRDISNAVDVMGVVTGEVGTDASFTNVGTPTARDFVLTVPRGDKGADATITSATATTGAVGSSASVAIGGTPTARTFDFTIPRGDKGETGVLPNFYATTTADAPNTNIAADGSQKRSTYTFGTAATKNVGTASGQLVERGADGYPTNNNAIGVGQTWQDMLASRAKDTVYTNSTGRPITAIIGVGADGANAPIQISADGVTWVSIGYGSSVASTAITVLVPAGWRYKATFSLRNWVELR